jgi:hypothetical protein
MKSVTFFIKHSSASMSLVKILSVTVISYWSEPDVSRPKTIKGLFPNIVFVLTCAIILATIKNFTYARDCIPIIPVCAIGFFLLVKDCIRDDKKYASTRVRSQLLEILCGVMLVQFLIWNVCITIKLQALSRLHTVIFTVSRISTAGCLSPYKLNLHQIYSSFFNQNFYK